MNYRFGAARKLYAANAHPRVMLGAGDAAWLRKQIKFGDGEKIMTTLGKKVRRLVNFILEADDLPTMLKGDGSHNSRGAQVGYAVDDIAMVAMLDDDADAKEACKRLFAAVVASGGDGRVGISSLAMPFDLLYFDLGERERRAYTRAAQKAIRNQIRTTESNYFKCSAGNITLGTTLSAIPVILAIAGEPGVKDFSREMDYLITCLEATLHTVINPDGYPEEDTGYGTGVAAWLAQIAHWARRAGIYDVYKECPRFALFGRAMLHFVEPWGEDLANTGDHGDDFGDREFVLARLAAETKDPTLLWLLGTLHYHHGKVHPENTLPEFHVETPLRKGFRTHASYLSLLVLDELRGETHPLKANVPTAFCDRGRGIVSFRSGWKEDDTFVVFDGSQRSPSGQGHFHDSCSDFTLSAVGEYFAVGTGRYQIEQSQHSVVLIDGKSGRSTNGEWTQSTHHGLLIDYLPGDFCDFAAADSSHQHNCLWTRRYLGLVKGKGARAYVWTVEDINKNNDWGEYWWQLQTSPENIITTRANSATIKGWRHGNLLDVRFAIPEPHEYPRPHTLSITQDVCSTSSYKYIPDVEASVRRYRRPADMVHGPVYARPRLLGKVAGLNGRFMSVMIPRWNGEKPASVMRLKCIANSLAVKVAFENVEDTLIFAYEHNLLAAGGVEGRGQWCVTRRARGTGRVLAWELGNGTSLVVDGRKIV